MKRSLLMLSLAGCALALCAAAAPATRPATRPSTTRAATRPVLSPKLANGELMKPAPPRTPQKIQPVTPEESKEAIAGYKEAVAAIEQKMGVHFASMETHHFLIFTDWDKREYDFLKRNVENAYTAVSRQFELSPSENVFIGKLPVLMFAQHADFKRYSKDIEHFDVPDNVAGYYTQAEGGFGHMVMWKPDVAKAKGNVHLAELEWAYTLTHEFTHAFVARYRSNALVPRWLNEGLAEVVASRQFPIYRIYSVAKDQASRRKSIQPLFEEHGLMKAEDYPVAQTLVETLLAENPKTFLAFFNDIKDGMKPPEALQREYKTTLQGLESAWRKYLATTKDPK
jgi:hypothetical protein